MSTVILEGVAKRFGDVPALEGIDLVIEDGEFLVLLGPSGCGKSTLLRVIAGLVPPSAGRVIIDSQDVTTIPPRERNVAMVFQSYALFPHLTVERNLGFGLRVRGVPRRQRNQQVGEVADLLQLTELLDRRPRELSGGQRQRVAVGRAMLRDPSVYLMDEPLSNLDAKLRASTRVELTALHQRLKSTVVYVTHDQAEATSMGTKVVVMNAGRIEQVGTPTEIYDSPMTTFVADFIGSPAMNLIPVEVLERSGKVMASSPSITVPLGEGRVERQHVTLGIRPEHLHICPVGAGGPQAPSLRVRIGAVEHLGSEEAAIADVGGTRITLRGPRPLGVRPGDDVELTVEPARCHLFHPTSGRRLKWVPDDATAPSEPDSRESTLSALISLAEGRRS